MTEKNPKDQEIVSKNNDFHNKYRGVGFIFAKNGYTFKGNMQKGRKCGYGQEIQPSGKVSWGLWFDNKKNGEFLVLYEKKVYIELWRNETLKEVKQVGLKEND